MIPMKYLEDYDPDTIGRVKSDEDNLIVNNVSNVSNGYSLIFEDNTFLNINPVKIIGHLITLLRTKLPHDVIKISIEYLYELNDRDDDAFQLEYGECVLAFDVAFKKLLSMAPYQIRRFISYKTSENLMNVAETCHEVREGGTGDDEDENDDYLYSDDDPVTELDRILGRVKDDDKKKKNHHKKKKIKKVEYDIETSKVFRGAKNPKRSYRRHGILVARNKDAIRKDKRIIKDFLKEFIPGDAQWKKDLRNELADRWIGVYAVTVKQLKKLEHKHKKMMEEKRRPKIDTNRVLNFASAMVTHASDSWNNPNK